MTKRIRTMTIDDKKMIFWKTTSRHFRVGMPSAIQPDSLKDLNWESKNMISDIMREKLRGCKSVIARFWEGYFGQKLNPPPLHPKSYSQEKYRMELPLLCLLCHLDKLLYPYLVRFHLDT